jgi:hypothetical protein
MLVLVLEHHPDGPLTKLLRVPVLSRHGPNLSRVGASKKPEAVQEIWVRFAVSRLPNVFRAPNQHRDLCNTTLEHAARRFGWRRTDRTHLDLLGLIDLPLWTPGDIQASPLTQLRELDGSRDNFQFFYDCSAHD